MRTLLTFIAGAILVWGSIALLLALRQHAIVYQPTRTLIATPAETGLNFLDVTIDSGDGDRIHGWFLPASDARATVLFFHGNAGNISHRLETLKLFADLGLQTLIVDYRGYGQSTGKPGERQTREDAVAAFDWLVNSNKADPRSIIIYGRSLGGAVAAQLALERDAGALVLDSTFLSMRSVAKDHYWWLPVDLALTIHYDTESALRSINTRVAVFHSIEDEVVNFYHGETLYSLAREPKTMTKLRGSHNTIVIENRERYMTQLSLLVKTMGL